ncbi:uncharacterized protein LOC107845584 isoform X1 [Capsicum annuum]|uniref:uncharacterized protein LOC107845584 isoform X1 n=1 Tax=Capsicum annuum TaxID=4072 RepID=UPI001FB09472|nr:uncharacterized protein LOC107845584 isoform X1 [Capsicum annuum]
MADGRKECPTSPQAATAQLFGVLSSLLQQVVSSQWSKLKHYDNRGCLMRPTSAEGVLQCPKLQCFGGQGCLVRNNSSTSFSSVLVESLTNQEEVELRSKIYALGLEVTKVPSKSTQNLDEMEIAKQLDKLSEKLDDVDRMISSAVAADPQVGSLLCSTANLWMPVITAGSEERRNLNASVEDDLEVKGKNSQ